MINWSENKDEVLVIHQIAERAAELGADFLRTSMDVEATHCNGCPLRLQELLSATPFDFTHDIAGIAKHINRETGKLEGCFLPRYAVQ